MSARCPPSDSGCLTDAVPVSAPDSSQTFDRALLYGHGCALAVFDVLLFCCVDMVSSSTLLAALVVFCAGKVSLLLGKMRGESRLRGRGIS